MRKLLVLLTITAALGVTGIALAKGTKSVGMGDNYFFNGTVTIKKGSAVHWHWSATENVHNVVSRAKGESFHSKTRHTGSLTHTFRHKGTFTIICTKHKSTMRMTVKVV
jgi:plastocyanin